MTSANFAAAQERIAARQRARAAASQAHLSQQRSAIASTAIGRLPPAFTQAALSLKIQWDRIKGREGSRPAFRVGQVDAELLDEELLELFKGQAGEALKYYGPHLRDDWAAEIQLALRAVLFKLTLWDHDASYGAALQGLRYADAWGGDTPVPTAPRKWQKGLYGLLSVGGRYAWTRWENYLADIEGSYDAEPSPLVRKLSRLSSRASSAYSVAAFASFLVFLVNGKYRTVLDRLLRLRLLPTTSQVSREVSFEYLNRQLVWHAFTEFLLFILPLVGISRWRRWLARAWRKARSLFRRSGDDEEDDETTGGELAFLPERTCAICYQDQNPGSSAADGEMAAISGSSSGVVGSAATDITNPYEALPCGCVYCFVCLAQRIDREDGEGWTCLRCAEIVRECRPWHGDVVQERSRPSSGKSVTFAEDSKDSDEGLDKLNPGPENVATLHEFDDDVNKETEEQEEDKADDLVGSSEQWTRASSSDEQADHSDKG